MATFRQPISSFQGRWEGPPLSPDLYLTRVTEPMYALPPNRPDQAVPGISARFGDFIEAECLSRGERSNRLQDVSEQMKARHLKNIPVVDEGNRPLGVLTARAVLRVLLSDAEFEEAQLVDYVKGVGYR